MGKPRMILLIRHAQSEGNKNREIHQMVPDHRVKLTQEGRQQADEAGRRLRSMLNPDDTIRIFTSPYRRTRETTEGILKSLTETTDDCGPSPFSRQAIKVFEEPRLREQDFGNFQPCSAEMERMWQERADYGHFFYRIPNGESAADAYDRVSGFNESLWRAFSDDDFPSVAVLVTHGLMTRVFLMKWYHWSVEYFEDLRNINHCEFVIMKRDMDNGKYVLENKLRTWSELKRRATINTKPPEQTQNKAGQQTQAESPAKPVRKWGGCVDGCNHQHHQDRPRRRQSTMKDSPVSGSAKVPAMATGEKEDHPVALQEAEIVIQGAHTASPSPHTQAAPFNMPGGLGDRDTKLRPRPPPMVLRGRDAGGTLSGAATPMSESEGFNFAGSDVGTDASQADLERADTRTPLQPVSAGNRRSGTKPRRQPTVEDLENWARQSGMGSGARADALGDEPDDEDDDSHGQGHEGDGEETTEAEKQFGYRAQKDFGSAPAQEVNRLEREEEKDKSLRESVY